MGKFVNAIQIDLEPNNQLTFLLGKALTKDDSYFKTGIDSLNNTSNYFLNDFLEFKLLENGIKKEFSYILFVKDSSKLQLISDNFIDRKKGLIKYPIKLNGYLPNLVKNEVILELHFNRINNYFLSQLSGLTIPSLLFLTAIIAVVIWVLKSFYWQQSIITRTNDFINNLTHELKTPVFSIGLATKMLQQKVTKEDETYLNLIKDQNNRLKQHIDKVLQLASLDKNRKTLNFEVVDFLPILKKICEEFEVISAMEQVTFNYEIIGSKYLLRCDAMHLSNAINNLLDNAKKYCKDSPVIKLTSQIKSKKLVLTIQDNGIGIDKKNQKKIFKKHYRVLSGDLYTVKGYGLGLNYVKKIIKLHKGKIALNSEINQGTSITVKLPIIRLQ